MGTTAEEEARFYMVERADGFGATHFDIPAILQRFPATAKVDDASRRFPAAFDTPFHRRIYRSPFLRLRRRRSAFRALRMSGLDRSWFDAFRGYWSEVIGGRPLWGPEDLYFLRGYYRLRFQTLQVPDDADTESHLAAYQRPEMIHFLLQQVYKGKLIHQLGLLTQVFQASPGMRSFVEYGCAAAPITATMYEFYRQAPRMDAYLFDLDTLHLQYAAYRFRECAGVRVGVLSPESGFQMDLKEPVDAVFCMTVFEHLDAPFETARRFHEVLRPGGLLAFDYVISDAQGLDSLAGLEQRQATLAFIEDHFEVVKGTIDKERSMAGLTLCRKR